jgi:nickel transport system substrate-binding protein
MRHVAVLLLVAGLVTAAEPLRIGVLMPPRAMAEHENRLTPLAYGGGFLTKTQVFETLVTMNASGTPGPGLALDWEVSPEGTRYTFRLRPGARFHDGSRCDAAAVKAHFERWIGDDLDKFLGAATRIREIAVEGEDRVAFQLTEPYPLPLDLAVINPMGVVGPGATRDEERVTMTGTGPYRVARFDPMHRIAYERFEAYDARRPRHAGFEMRVFVSGAARDPVLLWALERGHIDAAVEDWVPSLPRAQAAAFRDKGFRLIAEPGSSVVLLLFHQGRAPFSDIAWRQRVAAVLDRGALIRDAEDGFARPCTGLFAPWVAGWPEGRATTAPPAAPPCRATLLVPESDTSQVRAALELARQLRPTGLDVVVDLATAADYLRRANAGDFDLAFGRTWGVPYDPHATLYARLGPQPGCATAVRYPPFRTDPGLSALVLESCRARDDATRRAVYARIQAYLDGHAVLVPLYVPDRLAVVAPGVEGLGLGPHGYTLDLG